MGLDMYLYATQYIGCWNHSTEGEKLRYNSILTAIGLDGFRCEGSPSIDVRVTVAYWRKANAIHRWFVQNVQEGKDECQSSYVDREQLQRLVADCKAVLDSVETVDGDLPAGTTYYSDGRVEHKTIPGKVLTKTAAAVAAEKLPTQGGFFFGSTEYDQYYLDDLRDTVKQVSAVLDDPRFKNMELYYRASW